MSHVHVNGPHLGPVHTTLWSSGHRRHPVPFKGWLLLYFGSIGGIAWAFTVALALGIVASGGLALIVFLAVYGALAARRVSRSRAYRKAHPQGPRDWEQAS